MIDTYRMSSEDFLKNSRLPTRVMASEVDMYREMAQIIADVIEQKKGATTVVICPVGPIGQYPFLAEEINRRRLDLKNCWFINMDEYLDEYDQPISAEDPLSFHGIMNRVLYSKLIRS